MLWKPRDFDWVHQTKFIDFMNPAKESEWCIKIGDEYQKLKAKNTIKEILKDGGRVKDVKHHIQEG